MEAKAKTVSVEEGEACEYECQECHKALHKGTVVRGGVAVKNNVVVCVHRLGEMVTEVYCPKCAAQALEEAK